MKKVDQLRNLIASYLASIEMSTDNEVEGIGEHFNAFPGEIFKLSYSGSSPETGIACCSRLHIQYITPRCN